MTLKEVKNEISRLKNMARQLEEEERDAHREAARQFVGKCYKHDSGEVLKIIGIPRTFVYMSGDDYNQYQFPAVFLKYPDMPGERLFRDELDEFAPCYCATVYFNIKLGMPGCPGLKENELYKEITQEEFDAEYDKCMAYFKEKIKA